MQNNRINFWSRNYYFWKVPISYIIQNHWKKLALLRALQFQFNCGTCPMDNCSLWNCLWAPNAYKQVAKKVFLCQMLEETSIFTLPGKVPLWQRCQNNALCRNMNVDVSPYILKFKFFFKSTCSTMAAWIPVGLLPSKSEMIYLPKEVCLIIIHRNPTYILDMSCCY